MSAVIPADPAPVDISKRRLPRIFGIKSEKLGGIAHRVKRASSGGGNNNGSPVGPKLRRRQRWAHTKARATSKNIRGGKK
jgi:hypothetical protein